MKVFYSSERVSVVLFFLGAIVLGTLLLMLPLSWKSNQAPQWIEALFTSVSAICVVGLSIVDVSGLSFFGTTILLVLIQVGGLGIITIYFFYLIIPRSRVSLHSSGLIREYFVTTVEHKPKHILLYIFIFTLGIELLGAILLYITLNASGYEASFYYSLFHSVSAFCNAGFSLNSTSLEGWGVAPLALILLSLLIFAGGIGFVVIRDLFHSSVSKRNMSLHTKVVLRVSFFLVLAGFLLFAFVELFLYQSPFAVGETLLNSFFLSVSSRTAGFNYLPIDQLSPVTQMITTVFMFIGGSSASSAGGIKTTTFILFVLFLFHGDGAKNGVKLFNRKISSALLQKAVRLVIKLFLLLAVATLILFITERPDLGGPNHLQLFFEVVSAIGTVGLSTGITTTLTLPGKLVIIFLMFVGRIGLIIFALGRAQRKRQVSIEYPEGEVLVG